MKFKPTRILTAYLQSHNTRQLVGRLAVVERQVAFEYDASFLNSGIELSPFKLPLEGGVKTPDTMIFDGLFGLFNDSMPDGWGRLLLDRSVEKHWVSRGELTVLDRLSYVGRCGMGALSYEPDNCDVGTDHTVLRLDTLAEECAVVLAGESEEVFEDLLRLNGSSSGARPKIVAQVSDDKKRLIHGQQDLQNGFSHWIVKFPSSPDRKDTGAIEFAYSLMAREAGIEMPETHLFRTKKSKYFATKRFDRSGDARVHMHSLSGLIHADHRVPTLDYDMLLKVTCTLTKDVREVQRAFALACFNVLAHNRDDHAKNFSFLLSPGNDWTLSPAYDLVFSYGPGGEQSMMVMGEGRNPTERQLQDLAKKHSIKDAAEILEQVKQAVSNWARFAKLAGVSQKSSKEIASKLLV